MQVTTEQNFCPFQSTRPTLKNAWHDLEWLDQNVLLVTNQRQYEPEKKHELFW